MDFPRYILDKSICRRCGKQGHTDLTCTFDPQPGNGNSAATDICFECGKTGHQSKERLQVGV